MKKYRTEDFDFYAPSAGHRERFLYKLDNRSAVRPKRLFHPQMIAAVLLIFLGLMWMRDKSLWNWPRGNFTEVKTKQEAVTDFITEKMLEWENNATPESGDLIRESQRQLLRLDEDFARLQKEFEQTGNPLVLEAMLRNTRQKQELLEELHQKLLRFQKIREYEKCTRSL